MAELSDEPKPKRAYRSHALTDAARAARETVVERQRREKRRAEEAELDRQEAQLEKELAAIRRRRRRLELDEANRVWRRLRDPDYYADLGGPKPPGSSMAAVVDFNETLVVGNGARRTSPKPAAQ